MKRWKSRSAQLRCRRRASPSSGSRLHGYREADFGDADNMARGKNTSVESVALAGVVEAEGGKVRLVTLEGIRPGRL